MDSLRSLKGNLRSVFTVLRSVKGNLRSVFTVLRSVKGNLRAGFNKLRDFEAGCWAGTVCCALSGVKLRDPSPGSSPGSG
jgi:hypothetical protein